MATPNFPQHIMEEILIRLSVKSLVRFKSASKSWSCLISSPPFAKLQFDFQRASNNTRVQNILLSTPKDLKFFRESDFSHYDGAAASVGLDFPRKGPGKRLKILGSCNGLVAIAFDDVRNLFKDVRCFFIWNPSTGDCRKLPDPNCHSFDRPDHDDKRFVCGFGYESSSEDYKLFFGTYGWGPDSPLEAEIFSLRKNTWRITENPPFSVTFCFCPRRTECCALVSGALHCRLMQRDNAPSNAEFIEILAFDLKTEKFRGVPIRSADTAFFFGLGVVEGKLSVMTMNYRRPIQLWVMEEYGNKESWTLLFSIKTDNLTSGQFISDPVCFSERNVVFTMRNAIRYLLVSCDAEEENIKEFQICYHLDQSEIIAYTESLFSPNFYYKLSAGEQ